MEIALPFPEALDEAIKTHYSSAKAASYAMDISHTTLYDLLKGRIRPNPSLMERIAAGLPDEAVTLYVEAGIKPPLWVLMGSNVDTAATYERIQRVAKQRNVPEDMVMELLLREADQK